MLKLVNFRFGANDSSAVAVPDLCSRFLHDVTKIQTKKLSILLSFYFQGVLQQLNTLIQSNFRFERVIRLAIEDALISSLLRDAAFSWRPGELLWGVRTTLTSF